MNRRDFLQKSSIAAVAVTGLPRAIRHSRQTNYPSVYKTELKYGVPDQLYYEVGLYHSTVQNFSAAKDEEKMIGLKVNYYATTDQSSPSKTGEFKYLIKSVEQTDKTNNIWRLTTKPDHKDGDYKLPKNFSRNLDFECKPYAYINIFGKKDALLANVPYPPTPSSSDSDGGGCFLTTACVIHRGLADDCEELTALRSLRDDYMTTTEEGRQLAAQYRQLGPEIVNAINAYENRAAIYDYMYRHMILPSVELVQQGRPAAATNYYKTFVKALKEKYC